MKIPQFQAAPDQPSSVPPVYCRSITITNFRCFSEPTKIDLLGVNGRPAQWTVILGENGIGKTSVLQCLAGSSVRPGMIPAKNQGQPGRHVVEPLWSAQPWLSWILEKRHYPQQPLECKLELQRGTLLDGTNPTIQEWNYDLSTRTSLDRHEVTVNIMAAPAAEMGGFLIYGYGAGRRMALTSRVNYVTTPDESLGTLFADDRPLANAEEWILELDHLAKTQHPGKAKAKQALDSVRTLLLKILPDIIEISTAVTRSQRADGSAVVRAKFHHASGAVLNVEDLSFGYQTMTSWLVDLTRRLFQRYPDSNNPLADPAIVLVDEVDLHLHPKWQQTVMDYLSDIFVNTQFIVTAHSPLIIQSRKASNIVLIQRSGKSVKVHQDLESIKDWRVDQILTSDLFGLEQVRSPEVERVFDERSALLGKSRLSTQDKRRLAELNRTIESLPSAETKEMREIENLLRRVAAANQAK